MAFVWVGEAVFVFNLAHKASTSTVAPSELANDFFLLIPTTLSDQSDRHNLNLSRS